MFPVALSPPRNPGMSQDTEDGETSSSPDERWMRSSNEEPMTIHFPVRSPQAETQLGNTADALRLTMLMSLKKTRRNEISQTVQSIFIWVFICQGFNAAQILCARYHLNLMHWGVASNTHAVLHVNVHPNIHQTWTSHTKLQNKDAILGSTTSRWVITSAAFKSKQSNTNELLCCVSERLWLW